MGVGPRLCPYSPECVEEEFSEVRTTLPESLVNTIW
jgi:hypothetical protein